MNFTTKYARSSQEVSTMKTEELRNNFLVESLFENGQANIEYLHYDRIVVGGVVPQNKSINLEINTQIGAKFFLERRELGIINIGGSGKVEFDNGSEELLNLDGLYLPVGNQKIVFSSLDAKNPAKFYLFSTQGLLKFPVVKVNIAKSQAINLGDVSQSNVRTIYQYFHPNVCKTNSLLMGVTLLAENNMWNTMPCHTHERRTECYLYFNVKENDRVIHLMGKPQETKHLIVANQGFVISPSWSVHSGVGTSNYSFIWAMGGENLDYTDMQGVATKDLK
ncbi:5-dehydro-4-deoxy-D-glucuronate isomerase [Mycoplasmopsis alligatoris]|uniref:4-deoxy-L-threo-5-hexosulose-uronate ketol-isomerase n=1 Tax=Mycoplasmopsis alligatoris A21JP2 TaxID=747682 RepID=D4XVT3_9BACT|nr:5-dehydro-4-deoxy-D-glucuronate isomerase [Mycoplasmopsis alligatoris]EFF41543.1 5-keto 4-deoxyuronate isomerase [Mycoplasmopsis alligatoris A21JP2]